MPTYKTKVNTEINKGSITIKYFDNINDHPNNI
jgi:hypothetical protein